MEKTKSFVSENVRRLRNKLGITQSELAEKANLSLIGIQGIEYGKSGGRGTTLSAIAKALGVTVEDLYRDPNEKIEEKKPLNQAFTLTEAQLKAISEEAANKGAQAVLDAINKTSVPKTMTEKDELIASISSLLPLLNINNLKAINNTIQRAISKGNVKKSVNS